MDPINPIAGNPEAIDQIASSPTSNARSYPHIITLVVLLLTAIGAGSYYYLQYQKLASMPNPTPPESSQIKPIETPQESDPTADWKTYTNDNLGFSFKYPTSFLLNQSTKGTNQNSVSVRIKDLANYQDEPLGYDLKTALEDKYLLEKGQYGDTYGSIANSQTIKTLPNNLSAKTFTILRQIEVCDVQFTHTAIFYYQNHQIIITTSAPFSLAKELSAYFTTDEANCGGSPVWKNDNTFFSDLQNQKAPKIALDWYESLDQILSTFKFTNQKMVTDTRLGYIKSINANSLSISEVTWIDDISEPNGFRIEYNNQPSKTYALADNVGFTIIRNLYPELDIPEGGSLDKKKFLEYFNQSNNLKLALFDFKIENEQISSVTEKYLP